MSIAIKSKFRFNDIIQIFFHEIRVHKDERNKKILIENIGKEIIIVKWNNNFRKLNHCFYFANYRSNDHFICSRAD